MFKYIGIRNISSTIQKYLSVLPQESLSNKTLHIDNLPSELEKSSPSLTSEVTVYNKIPNVQPKTVSSFYINESEVLQELLKLNVNLYKVEKVKEAFDFILQRKFDHIREHIILLKEFNLEDDEIGKLITTNPLILKEDLNDLRVRINYLQYKKFSDEMITAILRKNPFWLSHSTENIDECLGAVQKLLGLSSSELRHLASRNSKVITYPLHKLKLNVFSLTEEMGFTADEMKQIVLRRPKFLLNSRHNILKTFEYLQHTMNIPHNRIVQESEILAYRENRLKQRHLYLLKLGRAQYDPKQPNYVSLKSLVSATDSVFCTDVAKSPVKSFNLFLKSL